MGASAEPMLEAQGQGVSPGIAIGQAVCIQTQVDKIYRFPLQPENVEDEVRRFHDAVEETRDELVSTRGQASEAVGDEIAAIFDAHALLLTDRALLERIESRIRREQVNAEWAVLKAGQELRRMFDQIEAPHLRERHQDLEDVTRYLLRCLQGIAHPHDLSEIEGDVVVVAHDLTPSEAVRLGRQHVVGFAVETGGPTSHTAIIARALDIPLVAGLIGIIDRVTDRDPVIIDGELGLAILHPTPEQLARYRQLGRMEVARDRARAATRELPCVTRDGVAVQLLANIELLEELEQARRFGAEGVGLYRSEFLFIERSPELPDEEEHVSAYRQLMEGLPGPAVIRTFDLGGRKLAREVLATEEDNPVLGLRGIRLTLARKEIFRVQMRALFRAGVYGPLNILLPMVATLEEIRDFRRFASEVIAELRAERVEHSEHYRLGAMIEVPSAALMADRLASEVDFLSIGTNDLIQYALAVDRGNEHVAYLYRPFHPAILRMILSVVEGAAAAGVEVSVCGEMASDGTAAALLVGMGIRQLSMGPRRIPEVKTRIRELSAAELETLAADCLTCGTATEVEEILAATLEPAAVAS